MVGESNDRYSGVRTVHPAVTDDADRSNETGSTDGDSGGPRGPSDVSEVDFADLSLPQRVFVAAVQNPTRGVVIVALFAFAFSFYIAFWMVFPGLAALFSGIAVVLGAALAAIYYLFDRYVD